MMLGYGNNNLLLIAFSKEDVDTLQRGLTLEYIGLRMLTKDVIVVYGDTKADVVEQLTKAGVVVSEDMRDKYFAGGRTDDGPRRDH